MKTILLYIMLILSNSLLSAQCFTIPKDYYYYQVTVEATRVINGGIHLRFIGFSHSRKILGVEYPLNLTKIT